MSYSLGESATRIVVVGDTGTGERAYHPGFMAVQKAMRGKKADALLHLGDFVYQPGLFPTTCPDRYIKEIKETLSDPYQLKIYVAGDNDLPPKKSKPKASGVGIKSTLLIQGLTLPALGPLRGHALLVIP